MKKLGLIVLLLSIAGTTQANCGNDNGNGNGCSGNTGPQGPVGPQGQPGTDGLNGTNGTDGKDGSNAQERVNYWRGTDLVGDFAVRLYDGKRVQLQVFDMYAFGSEPSQDIIGAGRNLMIGGRVVFKLGSSYEERELAKIKKALGIR